MLVVFRSNSTDFNIKKTSPFLHPANCWPDWKTKLIRCGSAKTSKTLKTKISSFFLFECKIDSGVTTDALIIKLINGPLVNNIYTACGFSLIFWWTFLKTLHQVRIGVVFRWSGEAGTEESSVLLTGLRIQSTPSTGKNSSYTLRNVWYRTQL